MRGRRGISNEEGAWNKEREGREYKKGGWDEGRTSEGGREGKEGERKILL